MSSRQSKGPSMKSGMRLFIDRIDGQYRKRISEGLSHIELGSRIEADRRVEGSGRQAGPETMEEGRCLGCLVSFR